MKNMDKESYTYSQNEILKYFTDFQFSLLRGSTKLYSLFNLLVLSHLN